MKKRLRGLLALTLALCMGLGMTTGIASAVDLSDGLSTIVSTGETLSAGSGGYVMLSYDGTLAAGGSTDLYEKTGNSGNDNDYEKSGITVFSESSYPTVKSTDDAKGYVEDKWNLSVGAVPEADKYYIDHLNQTPRWVSLSSETAFAVNLTKIPLNYTIKYYDDMDKTNLLSQQTVEYDDPGTHPTYIGDGYQVTKWTPFSGGNAIVPGDAVTTDFLSSNEIAANAIESKIDESKGNAADNVYTSGYTIELYAAAKEEIPPKGADQIIDITFDKNAPKGAKVTGTMANQNYAYGYDGPLYLNKYTCEGYTFKGWNTMPDGSGAAYADGASVKAFAPTDGADITNIVLFAQWEKTDGSPDSGDNTPREKTDGSSDAADNTSREKTDSSPDSGDNTPLGLLAMLTMASLAGIAAYMRRKA